MSAPRSAQGYAEEAPALLQRYEAISFAEAHGAVLDRLPQTPSRILDIGAGTGRDASYFSERGHRVLAVEPTAEMREGAIALHPSPAIFWLDDALPDLARVRELGETFDLFWLSAVWMHLDSAERRRGMGAIGSLARGALMMTLRHGPVPAGRRMFEVSAEETIALAETAGFVCTLSENAPSGRDDGLRWTRLWFERAR